MIYFWRRLRPYALIFLLMQFALRMSLVARAALDVELSAHEIIQIMLRGLWFDAVTAGFVLLPIALAFWLFKTIGKRTEYALRFVYGFALCFDFVAEHLFWSEFATRFNFIAVDYLIYTQEVVGNIKESYPLGALIAGIALAAAALSWASMRAYATCVSPNFGKRTMAVGGCVALLIAAYQFSHASQAQFDDNAEAGELAANGIYNLFHAFRHNEINYERFYLEHDKRQVLRHARTLLDEEYSRFEDGDGLVRVIKPQGAERHKNVMLVVMESMSADYMAAFGNKENLTPNLDRFAKEGLFFTDLYATGTRTVRGLEAVTLSVPPTPGQSIIRRPDNANLFSLGFVFKDRGYDTQFIYGGYGYFDNMNEFFSGNGFDIVDRTRLSKDEIHFANIWGVADDDMFARAVREADASYAAGKPFMHLIMTTSNHRPYTYPEGRIDIPPKTGRTGGVKYADYSIGQLIEWASAKPWFKDTVFVFVADHTAGAAGKAELDPKKYHIPMILYAPGFIAPGRYEKIASQIDLAPILLGQLNFHYRTKFYGEDLLHDPDDVQHAFISNYQKVALVKAGGITVLAPKRDVQQFTWLKQDRRLAENHALIDDTVAYYQSASWWRESLRRVPTVLAKQ